MNSIRAIIAIIIFLLIGLVPGVYAVENSNRAKAIVWLNHAQGLAAGKHRHLPIMVYFWGTGCRYCEVMEKTGFRDPEIVEYVAGHLVPVKVHIQSEPEIARLYRVSVAPSIFFLTPEGKVIDMLIGYVSREKLNMVFHYIGDGVYKTKDYAVYEKEQKK